MDLLADAITGKAGNVSAEIKELTAKELKTELAALKRDDSKGFDVADSIKLVELELLNRGVK